MPEKESEKTFKISIITFLYNFVKIMAYSLLPKKYSRDFSVQAIGLALKIILVLFQTALLWANLSVPV